MSFSIDGVKHKTNVEIKYGDEFFRPRRNYEVDHVEYGHVNIYVLRVGMPSWTNRMSVRLPVEYWITQIFEGKPKPKKKRHLRVIK